MATYILRRILIAIPGPAGDHDRQLRRAVARAGRSSDRAHGSDRARAGPAEPAAARGAPARARSRPARAGPLSSSGCGSAVQGDLGYSIQSHRPISEEIAKRIPPTLALMVVGDPDRDHRRHPVRDPVRAPPVLEGRLRHDDASPWRCRACPRSCWASPASTSSPSGWISCRAAACRPSASRARSSGLREPPDAAGDGARARPAPPRCCATRGRACSRRSTASTSSPPRRRASRRTPSSSAMPSGTRSSRSSRSSGCCSRARGRRRHHRADLRLAGHGPARRPRRERPRPGADDGRRPRHRNRRAGHEHPRRRHLRPRRPEGPPWPRDS